LSIISINLFFTLSCYINLFYLIGLVEPAALDYIIQNNGQIYDAISTQPWSGEAVVHVSIINWLKMAESQTLIYRIDHQIVSYITSSLKAEIDVSQAVTIKANLNLCFKGVQPSDKDFIITEEKVKEWVKTDPKNKEVLKLFVQGQDLAQNPQGKPERWIIDFNDMSLEDASEYILPFIHVKTLVKPKRDTNRRETTRLNWWKYGEKRPGMRKALANLPFYFVVPRVSKWSIFILAIPDWLPGDGNNVVSSDDFYILGILTSNLHRQWVKAQSSTLKSDTRYTHNTCFETFPFPQNCPEKTKNQIRSAMQTLHDFRTEMMENKQWGITQIYNEFFNDPASQLAKLHKKLDQLVSQAYGIKATDDPLQFLLDLNTEISVKESQKLPVIGPGSPN
jgi:hypothetical protein